MAETMAEPLSAGVAPAEISDGLAWLRHWLHHEDSLLCALDILPHTASQD